MDKTGNKYRRGDNVTELVGTKDFRGLRVKTDVCPGFGLLKIYAPWCPHCTDMVEDMKFLGKELKKHNIHMCALNSDNPNNRDISRQLNVTGIPSLWMIKHDGELENINELLNGDRSVQSLLNVICTKTMQYVSHKKDAKCCKKVTRNNRSFIECYEQGNSDEY